MGSGGGRTNQTRDAVTVFACMCCSENLIPDDANNPYEIAFHGRLTHHASVRSAKAVSLRYAIENECQFPGKLRTLGLID